VFFERTLQLFTTSYLHRKLWIFFKETINHPFGGKPPKACQPVLWTN
jgi:hypothetical protein